MNNTLQENESRYTLYLGDCLEVMKDIPAGSVDAIICDPPFGTTQNKWDSIIPLESMWEQYKRIARKDAAILIFSAQPFTSKLICSNIEDFKYEWIWEKTKAVGHLNARRRPMSSHEIITVFCAGKTPYNYQLSEGAPYTNKHKPGDAGDCYGDIKHHTWENTGTRFPRTVIKFANQSHPVHPTQKPVPLLEYLIKTYTNEGDTVLDNCAGSFSTGIACLNTGRKFIGIEMDDKYFALGAERMKTHDVTR